MDKKFYKTCSKHAYYQYLNRYDPLFIAQYQTGFFTKIGRQGAYKTLVLKYASDHNNLEEEHNYTYKMHIMVMNLLYRGGWYLLGTIIIWNCFLLGDPGKVFNTSYWDFPSKQSNDMDIPTRYESLYIMDRSIRF